MAGRALELDDELSQALSEAVARIVETAQPEAIILFGSYAEGQAGKDSDVDLLVIARTNSRHRLATKLYLLWHGLRHALPALPPADILVYTPRQFLDAQVVGFVAYQAVRQGVILYGQVPEASAAMAG